MDLEIFDPGDQAAGGAQPMAPELVAQLRPIYEQSITELEKQLAGLDPADTEYRAALTDAIAQTKANLAQLTGDAQPAAAAAPAANELKVPIVPDRAMTRAEALANLRKLLEMNCTPEALAAFAASEEAKTARGSAEAAVAAVMVKRPLAAVAALLRAHELEPGNGSHLANLAGVASTLGLPRHALALLEGVERPGAMGVPGRAMALTTRGHALVKLRRYADAEAALREAVRLSPELTEARVNLAHALYRQDDEAKKKEAVRFMGFARRRVAASPQAASAPPAVPTTESQAEDEQPEEAAEDRPQTDEEFLRMLEAQRGGRPPAAEVFDMSRGKRGRLPTVRIPRTIGDGLVLDPTLKAIRDEGQAQLEAITTGMGELDRIMRRREDSGEINPASARRARDVFWYIANAHTDPALRTRYAAMHRAAMDPGVGIFGGQLTNPFGSHELMAKHDAIGQMAGDFDAICHAMRDAAEPYHGSWQAPIRNYYNEAGQYFRLEYRHTTALAANLADPVHHEYARLMIRQRSISRFHEFLAPLIAVTNWDKHFGDSWRVRPGQPAQPGDFDDGEHEDAEMCPHHLRGEYKVKASLAFVEVSGNCEKVALEVSAGKWIKLFGEVEVNNQDEVAIFIGGAGESAPAGVGVEAAVKAGFFIKFDGEGNVIDFGAKTTPRLGRGCRRHHRPRRVRARDRDRVRHHRCARVDLGRVFLPRMQLASR